MFNISLRSTLLACTFMYMTSVASVSAFTVTTTPALSLSQCTEVRDGSPVYESGNIYVHANGTYSDANGTYQNLFLNDMFINYGGEYVIRGSTSNINMANSLP